MSRLIFINYVWGYCKFVFERYRFLPLLKCYLVAGVEYGLDQLPIRKSQQQLHALPITCLHINLDVMINILRKKTSTNNTCFKSCVCLSCRIFLMFTCKIFIWRFYSSTNFNWKNPRLPFANKYSILNA